MGVVVRRYIDFLILLIHTPIPTPLVSVLFCSSIPTFVHKKNVFHSFRRKKNAKSRFFLLCTVHTCVIVYLARDIPAFVMYCVYETSRSSLLIESTDSMIFCCFP